MPARACTRRRTLLPPFSGRQRGTRLEIAARSSRSIAANAEIGRHRRLGPDRFPPCHMSLSTAEPLWLSHPTQRPYPRAAKPSLQMLGSPPSRLRLAVRISFDAVPHWVFSCSAATPGRGFHYAEGFGIVIASIKADANGDGGPLQPVPPIRLARVLKLERRSRQPHSEDETY